MRRRWMFGVGALGCAACLPASGARVAKPMNVPARAATSATGATDPRGTEIVAATCRTMAAANQAIVAATKETISTYVPELATTCIPTGHGAWTFRIEATPPSGSATYAALHIYLAHLDATGTVDDEIDAPTLESGLGPGDNCCEVYGATALTVTPLVDYDHDGEIELYIGAVQSGNEGHHDERHTIFTSHGGAIAPLPAASKWPLVGVVDADKDGVPDLLLRYFDGERVTPCAGFSYSEAGPSLLGHARPDGTFSADDPVAKRFARALCPAAPTGDPLARDVPCSVLWGTQREVVAAYDRALASCRAANPGPFDACKNRPDPCDAREIERAYAGAVLPLTLP